MQLQLRVHEPNRKQSNWSGRPRVIQLRLAGVNELLTDLAARVQI